MPSPPPPPDPPAEPTSPPTGPGPSPSLPDVTPPAPLPPDPPPVKEPDPPPAPIKPPDPQPERKDPPTWVPPVEPPPEQEPPPPQREPPSDVPPIGDPPMPSVVANAVGILSVVGFVSAMGLASCTPTNPEVATPPPATTSAATKASSTLPTPPSTDNAPPPGTTTTPGAVPMEPPPVPGLAKLRVPAGFSVAVYAHHVENARSLTVAPSGTVFVGTRENDKVFAITDADKNGVGDAPVVVAEGLDTPNGVAFHEGSLYVAEVARILRFDDVEQKLGTPQTPVVVTDALPKDKHHGWKFIGIGPDKKLYVPIGAPCNVCDEKDPRYASIGRMNLDGSGYQVVARGIRNTVGFDWQPGSNVLFFTDNGRDMLGDDLPADELNRVPPLATSAGAGADPLSTPPHFGFPYCHAGTIEDPEHGKKRACKDTIAPVTLLGAHVAALGMRFYDGAMFGDAYKGQAFIAEHGSWNRSSKSGYRVVVAKIAADGTATTDVFAEGWLEGDNAWGRPVDVEVMADGALLISDDKANAIYRVSRS
ncbi:MAG TPA: sorbosone dehydrogenase family protein [Myxococcota bacterium]